MTKIFLEHQLERAKRGELTNALMNCHCKGVASIVFNDEPGNRIRMFFATGEHELWKNLARDLGQTVAYHSHHCDVKLVHIFGDVFNSIVELEPKAYGSYRECEYRSAIKGKAAALVPTGRRFRIVKQDNENLKHIGGLSMRAEQLHTMGAWKGRPCAWIVIEGKALELF